MAKKRGWAQRLTFVGIAVAAACALAVVLRLVGPSLPDAKHVAWFRAGCGFTGMFALAVALGVAIWNVIVRVRNRRDGERPTHPLFATCVGIFGIVLFGVAVASNMPPSRDSGGRPDSSIWAGYGVRVGVNEVSAMWIQPRVTADVEGTNVLGVWAGLSGVTNETMEQIGTQAQVQRGGQTKYVAWYEMAPKPPVTTTVVISAGDRIVVRVVSLGRDRYRLTLRDLTTGRRFSTVQVGQASGGTGGTIMAEVPYGGGAVLAGFTPIHFVGCSFNGKPIGDFHLTRFEIATSGGAKETATSPMDGKGTSFSITRR